MTTITRLGARGRSRKLRPAVVTSVIVLCAAGFTSASERDPSTQAEGGAAQQSEARGLFQEGVAELDLGRYAEALDYFQRAYSLWDSPKILLNIATTLRALGENAKAATAYARYLERAEPGNPRREEVEQALREVSVELARIVWPSQPGLARIWLDDVEISAIAGREVWVEPGEHLLVAERTSGSREARRVTVQAAGVQPIDWAEPLPSRTPVARPAKLEVDAARPEVPPSRPAYSMLRALARADFDLARGGAVGAGGLALEAHEFLRVTGGALIGAQKGAWVGLESAPLAGRVRPVFGTSAPVFFAGAMYPGISGELGLRFAATARLALFARAAVVHFPTVPTGYSKTVFVPSTGLEVGP